MFRRLDAGVPQPERDGNPKFRVYKSLIASRADASNVLLAQARDAVDSANV